MTSANFGSILFSSFGNTGVQSYSIPIDKAHMAYNSVPTTVGTCDVCNVSQCCSVTLFICELLYYILLEFLESLKLYRRTMAICFHFHFNLRYLSAAFLVLYFC